MVTVFGLGFVGLTTALGFAEMGHKVYGIEANPDKFKLIASGKLPFLEPGLDEALLRHLGHQFIPTTDLRAAIEDSEYVYYCVGTPYGQDGQADLTYLFRAMKQTLDSIQDNKFRVMVTKSTIPPSTTERKIIPFLEKHNLYVNGNLKVANNPEFLREGHCWEDFIHADRIVLGVEDARSEQMLRQLYENCAAPIFSVSFSTGEFIKYLSNTLLATLISYSNEMSVIADTIGGIDTADAFKVLHMDKRWGGCDMTSYVYPGCGYGGYCLPKDTNALYAITQSSGYDPKILKNVIATNEAMPVFIVNRIEMAANYQKKCKIGILGLSFKPGSDDVREASSAKIIAELRQHGYQDILGYDPVANNEFADKYSSLKVKYSDSYQHIIDHADILVIATAWDEFKNILSLTIKPVVDCRYML